MKELIRFSLYKRFNNRSTKLFNMILCIVIACACFSDYIMAFINPDFDEKIVVYTSGLEEDILLYLNEATEDIYSFEKNEKAIEKQLEDGYMVLEKQEKTYLLHSKYALSEQEITSFQMFLSQYHKDVLLRKMENEKIVNEYQQTVRIKNKVANKTNEIASDKSNIIFMFVTSVYFMMLSFVSGVASEVVNEKTTKTLELILTSVSAKVHFYAKLIVGWLVIVLQGIATVSYGLFFLLLRSLHDQGTGLILFINKLNIIEIKGNNIYAVIANLDFTMDLFLRVIYVLLFLLIGILLVQLLLVIVSSFVSTIEEAGNIQAPFYLLFLGFYYVVIAINNPYELSEGIGYYLSFVPFMNMLLMPCRILIQNVPIFEIFLSLSISIYLILMIVLKGSKVYERGVLDYSCKGFLQVMKRLHK